MIIKALVLMLTRSWRRVGLKSTPPSPRPEPARPVCTRGFRLKLDSIKFIALPAPSQAFE